MTDAELAKVLCEAAGVDIKVVRAIACTCPLRGPATFTVEIQNKTHRLDDVNGELVLIEGPPED